MLSRIFIDRPTFAWVLAVMVMLSGAAALSVLPVAQYPDVAPTQVTVRATYPGASAETIQNSVTQVIEQSLTGINGLLYFSSSSSSRGTVGITATFEKGVNPDIAQVQVQNQVQQAASRLPAQVQQQGLVVRKSNPDLLLIPGVYDETDRATDQEIGDFLVSTVQDAIARLPGVGDTNVFGSQNAMRIWLNPEQLASYQLTPGDVVAAIANQNAEVAAGELGGQPQPDSQRLNVTVTAQSRLQTPEQFARIVLKTLPNGASVQLRQVARVELGAENYNTRTRVNRHPGSAMSIQLAPGANALETTDRIKAEITRLSRDFPPGYKVLYTNDSSGFIKLSIREVVKTLLEAIVLVVIVISVFLQNWRATLIPTIAIPVVLLGTFALFFVAGFSINTLTLFALVLAIGLLVDDAIVVVENVERLLHENPDMTPREATVRSMKEITLALIAIALTLSAVFLPMAFFGGSTGVIYKQFSLTLVATMLLSVLVALILSPALTTSLMKQHKSAGHAERRRSWLSERLAATSAAFNTGFGALADRYQRAVRFVIEHKGIFLIGYVAIVAVLTVLFVRLPTGFLPTEDQGLALVQYQLPSGATQGRSAEVAKQVEDYVTTYEAKNLESYFTISGNNGQNTGQAFINFNDWSTRKGKANSADGIVARASAAFAGVRDARVFALSPPSVRGLGQANGFTMQLQNTGRLSRDAFQAARDRLLDMARKEPSLTAVRLTELPDVATLKIDVDTQKLTALGLTQADVNATLSTAWGGRYVNDFIDRGRVKRVYVQGDAPYRAEPQNLAAWYVRGSSGQMAPFSSFARLSWAQAPTSLSRFSGIESFEIQGSAAAGHSSGEAMALMEKLAAQVPGTSVAWSGLSYQERLSSGQAPMLYGLSLLVVFLCLAALYESWSIPLAVLLVIPIGVVGAIVAVTLRGLINDVFLQVGLLTTIGLTAKNAILIVEFAEQAERRGASIADAVLEAARLRLRPILMTSLAFMFGVLPLAISTGAGANSRVAIGTSVIGGVLAATILAIFYIPLFYVLVRSTLPLGLRRVFRRRGRIEAA
jgi:multidrug efflux pump